MGTNERVLPRSARRREEEEAETAADSPVRGKKGKGVPRAVHFDPGVGGGGSGECSFLEKFQKNLRQLDYPKYLH